MDKAHQKELQKNDLEVGLEKVASNVRPYYVPLAVGAVLLVVVAVGYTIYERNIQATNAAAWNKWALTVFDRNPSAEALRKVGDDLGNTPASLWAQQLAADEELREGSFLIYEDRELAQKKLDSSLDLYEKVAKEATGDPVLQLRARYGAARANECLFKVDAAIEMYQQIVGSEASNSALGKAAKERLELLKKEDTKNWYKWFATVEPPKPLPPNTPNNGGLNSFPSLPDVPNLNIPGATAPTTPASDPTKPATEPPATGEEPKKPLTEETPPPDREAKPSRFEEKPGAEEKPGTEEKPAEKPAEEKPAGEPPATPPATEPNPTPPKAGEEPKL